MSQDSKPMSAPQPGDSKRKQDRGVVKPWHGVLGDWSVAPAQRTRTESDADKSKRR
jgi:hypothetical protein